MSVESCKWMNDGQNLLDIGEDDQTVLPMSAVSLSSDLNQENR